MKTSSCHPCHMFLSILIPLVLRQLQSMKGLYYTEYPGCGTVLCVLVSPTLLDSSSASYGEVSISDARPLARRQSRRALRDFYHAWLVSGCTLDAIGFYSKLGKRRAEKLVVVRLYYIVSKTLKMKIWKKLSRQARPEALTKKCPQWG